MRSQLKVVIALVFAMLFWAFSFVWIKIAFESFQPLTIVVLRLSISTFLLFVGFGIFRKIQKVQSSDFKWIILLAFFEPFLYFMCESFGLRIISSTTGAVIVSTIPIITPFSAFLFYNEKLSAFNTVGIILSFMGVLVMIINDDFSLIEPLDGIILMFLAVFSGVGFNLLIKKVASKYNVYTITGYQNLFGLLMFLPFFIIFDWKIFISTPVSTDSITAVVELAVFASTFAFLLLTYGIRNIGVSKASVYANMIPVFTAIIAWWILGDIITMKKILGIAIVVTGLFLSQLKTVKTNRVI